MGCAPDGSHPGLRENGADYEQVIMSTFVALNQYYALFVEQDCTGRSAVGTHQVRTYEGGGKTPQHLQ